MPKVRDGASAPSQLDRFKEAARALECDEDEAAFDEKLKAIAKQRPKATKLEDGGPTRR